MSDNENRTSESKRSKERSKDERRKHRRERHGDVEKPPPPKKKKLTPEEENILTRTGGAYIPPAKLRMLQAQITDKTSDAFQRLAWEALKKSINGLINKVNVSNVSIIIRELFRENIIRGRGLLTRSILQAQAASPTFTHVYACFVAVINSKFPQIGELVLKRLIIQFKQGFRRNDKQLCLSSTRFVAHLVNQQVAHEILALEILTLLLESPTDDAVEVAIGFLKECGMKLTEVSPRGINGVFERLRSILHEGNLDKRVQYMIEVMFAIRKDKFADHPTVIAELDLITEAEQYTHLINVDEVVDGENLLNIFKNDPQYEENEEKYKTIRKDILDDDSEEGSGEEGESDDEDEEEEDEEDDEEKEKIIIDNTETNLISLRRTIYLTIQSSLDFEECAHKLLKMELKPGQEVELCHMILDCCAQQRTYEKFFGLLGQRFCQLNKIYVTPFEQIFIDSYDTIHRLETNKLRNVAKLFSHLLHTDAIGWTVLGHIRLNEEDTTSSSRIFIKILFQELSEYLGLPKLNERLKDVTLQEAFEGLFPRDNPRNTRFAINFFTSIGLGGLTDELREHLKTQSKPAPTAAQAMEDNEEEEEEEESESESEESSAASTSTSTDSEPEPRKHKKSSKKKKKSKKKEESLDSKKSQDHLLARNKKKMNSSQSPRTTTSSYKQDNPKGPQRQNARHFFLEEAEKEKAKNNYEKEQEKEKSRRFSRQEDEIEKYRNNSREEKAKNRTEREQEKEKSRRFSRQEDEMEKYRNNSREEERSTRPYDKRNDREKSRDFPHDGERNRARDFPQDGERNRSREEDRARNNERQNYKTSKRNERKTVDFDKQKRYFANDQARNIESGEDEEKSSRYYKKKDEKFDKRRDRR